MYVCDKIAINVSQRATFICLNGTYFVLVLFCHCVISQGSDRQSLMIHKTILSVPVIIPTSNPVKINSTLQKEPNLALYVTILKSYYNSAV